MANSAHGIGYRYGKVSAIGLIGTAMRDDGIPLEVGFYWTLRVGTKHTPHGTPEVVQLRRVNNGALFGDGFGDMELDEIGFAWQLVKPFDCEDQNVVGQELSLKEILMLTASDGCKRSDGQSASRPEPGFSRTSFTSLWIGPDIELIIVQNAGASEGWKWTARGWRRPDECDGADRHGWVDAISQNAAESAAIRWYMDKD